MYDLHTDMNKNNSQLERHFILHGVRSMVQSHLLAVIRSQILEHSGTLIQGLCTMRLLYPTKLSEAQTM